MTYETGALHRFGQPEHRTRMSPRYMPSASTTHGTVSRSQTALSDGEASAPASLFVSFRQSRVPRFTSTSNKRAWTVKTPVRISGDGTITQFPTSNATLREVGHVVAEVDSNLRATDARLGATPRNGAH